MNLALFDLDNTLLPIDSDYEWGSFLVRIGVYDKDIFNTKNAEFYEDYKLGRLNIHAYLNFLMSGLRSYSRQQLNDWHAQYMKEVIEPQIRPEALSLVRKHQSNGDLCAIVTATNSFITKPIATAFGVPHLLATEPEENDKQMFTGNILGTPCFREGKIIRVEQWLSDLKLNWNDFPKTTFYSDSFNDLALLEKVTHPVATNPDVRLLKHALTHDWCVLNLFNHVLND